LRVGNWASTSPHTMPKFHLTMVRHGETELNFQGIMQGQIKSDPPLNLNGRNQCIRLGKHFGDKDEVFTHVFCSDLNRTNESCRWIISHNPDFLKNNKSIIFDERIRERSFGDLEGISRDECKKMYPQLYDEDMSYKPPNGESFQEVTDRGKDFFAYLCRRIASENPTALTPDSNDYVANVLMVTHGVFMRAMYKYFINDLGSKFQWTRMSNAGRSCFEITLPPSHAIHLSDITVSAPLMKGVEVECLHMNLTVPE